MTTSADFGLPQLSQGQATPETTFNEAFVLVQALLNGVISQGSNSPPASPVAQDGDAYIVGTSPTGAWAGRPNCVAVYWGGSWRFIPGNDSSGTPITMGERHKGVSVYVQNDDRRYLWDGTLWLPSLGTDAGADPFYEVGTWTPGLTFTTPGDLSLGAYSVQVGWYERIGKNVFFSFRVNVVPTFTTASGALRITGFPFASVNQSLRNNLFVTSWKNAILAGYTNLSGSIGTNQNFATFNFSSATANSAITQAVATHVASGSNVDLRGHGQYRIN